MCNESKYENLKIISGLLRIRFYSSGVLYALHMQDAKIFTSFNQIWAEHVQCSWFFELPHIVLHHIHNGFDAECSLRAITECQIHRITDVIWPSHPFYSIWCKNVARISVVIVNVTAFMMQPNHYANPVQLVCDKTVEISIRSHANRSIRCKYEVNNVVITWTLFAEEFLSFFCCCCCCLF